jgi:hypothetical protein
VDDLREKAQRFLALAGEARDPEIAQLFRLLAADFLDLAQTVKGQQQQQIQPGQAKKPEDT